ncbi:NfeD family protein [Candidatus Methylacidithermus pantelleriae]|uniref:NfeD domain-containing protein n=1 Tax=Candidatus Methylacidithermus pantelleriae TaxID=2744239 RepID=A0A8J2BLN2_9BACT|nr:NfeD family protein [Candidatus Methylacidithermus pantelleriae]CAF0696998.1 NfeD domain-containing protein [Candidatus Methylacidithermus pantelleriae]
MGASWVICLFLSGLFLLIAETFVPGVILGVLGGLCIAGSLVCGFYFLGPGWGMGIAVAELGLLVGVFLAWIKFFPRTPLAKRMVLSSSAPASVVPSDWNRLVGQVGHLESPCRPVGVARIGGRRYTVASEEGFLPRGTQVRVKRVEGTQMIVESLRDPAG